MCDTALTFSPCNLKQMQFHTWPRPHSVSMTPVVSHVNRANTWADGQQAMLWHLWEAVAKYAKGATNNMLHADTLNQT